MAGRIPQNFIDDILDRTDIVELVDSRVKLKKSGKNYSACCPFHEERTPSFTVTREKQFYYCFGCGASGNAIGFLMEYDRLGFPEAVEQLSQQLGLELPREERVQSPAQEARQRDRKSLYALLEDATAFYRDAMRSHPQRKRAITYLKNRGLSGEVSRDFEIGFAPPGWDNLLRELGETEDAQRLLTEGGMLIQRESSQRVYDRFRDRIMFPIRDLRGRVVGFGGRVLGDSKPKYLNSPESPVFHKGEELYGLYQARRANATERLLVVEGYMDVVALAQFSIRNAVATLGTACREEHLHKAFRQVSQLVFCFDGDEAGRRAARRALESSLPVMSDGRQVKFLFLPEGEDPDTVVRNLGPDKFNNLVDHALPLEEFFFDTVGEGLDVRTMDGRARMSKLAAPLLDLLPKGVYRELMFNNLAKRTGLEVSTLLELVSQEPRRALAPEAPAEPETTEEDEEIPPPDTGPAPEPQAEAVPVPREARVKLSPPRLLTALLLQHPRLAASVEEPEEVASYGGDEMTHFVELLRLLKLRPYFNTAQIIGHLQGAGDETALSLRELATELGELMNRVAIQEDYDPAPEFEEALARLRHQHQRRRASAIIDELKNKPFAELSKEEKERYREALAIYAKSDMH